VKTLPIGHKFISFKNLTQEASEVKATENPISVEKEPPIEKESAVKKAFPYVTSALALASLCVAGYALKGKKDLAAKLETEMGTKLEESLNKVKDNATAQVQAVKNDLITKTQEAVGQVIEKVEHNQAWTQGYLGSLDKGVKGLQAQVRTVVQNKVPEFTNRSVVVAGAGLVLATTINSTYGKDDDELVHSLRTESTKRMLGLSEGLPELPENGMIRIPTSEVKPYASTGGMAIVPKEIAENLAKILAGKQDISVVLDIPLYTGQIEKNASKSVNATILRNKDGSFDYIKTVIEKGKEPQTEKLAELQLIDTMHLPIHTDTSVETEIVNIYKGEQIIKLEYDKVLDSMPQEIKEQMEETLDNHSVFESGGLVVSDKKGTREAYAKVSTVFYENRKFNLDAPSNLATNIYNDKATSAGETERFIYFSKFFYEHLANGGKSTVPLKADLILGNDWQTGAISAMTRLLSKTRSYFGANPEEAEKLQNTPIITIMHNAGLAGGAWHSQAKLLNIMFGEHAAKIVENAYMPNLYIAGKTGGLQPHLHNGMFEHDGINPQMMAVAYSDYIVPVSKGYTDEIATNDFFGGPRRELFEFRARKGAYSDLNNLKMIANQNGIDPSSITKVEPTLVGITNGCDKANNLLTTNSIVSLEKKLELPKGSLKPFTIDVDPLKRKNENKQVYLNKVIDEINRARLSNGVDNPMQIEMPELTDLTGVTKYTPIFVSAGRIVDQKGLDIFAKAIKEFYATYQGTEKPVFYVQGIGGDEYKQMILNVKRELAQTDPVAANRIVFANLFSEPGRYDGAKLLADFTVMSSWFEPCGLVHKEIGLYSGAVPVANKTGGLLDGLIDGETAVASEFRPGKNNIDYNAKEFAKAMQRAVDIYSDKLRYSEMVGKVLNSNFDWTKENGPIAEYLNLFKRLGVVSKEIDVNN